MLFCYTYKSSELFPQIKNSEIEYSFQNHLETEEIILLVFQHLIDVLKQPSQTIVIFFDKAVKMMKINWHEKLRTVFKTAMNGVIRVRISDFKIVSNFQKSSCEL